jgi:acyl-CoA thioesterase I
MLLQNRKLWLGTTVILALLLVFVLVEWLYIRFSGAPVAVPHIPRQQVLGAGPRLTYVVLGDSTAVGQGGSYEKGIAMMTAKYLARNHTVYLHNNAVSGARTGEVRGDQLASAVKLKPDVVLVAAGANDITHLSSIDKVRGDLEYITLVLQKQNPHVRVILTGAPAMGVVPRFPWPVTQLMAARTNELNRALQKSQPEFKFILVPIAEKTGPKFAADPGLFARDKFHPNDRGYAVWNEVLIDAMITAKL